VAEKIRLDRKCPVCSEGIGNLLGEVRFALYKDCPLQNCVPLVCCEKCGAVFYNTKSTEEDFSEYYENYLYYNQSQSRGMGGLSDSDRVRFAEVVRILEKNKVPKEGKIVDVGCAKVALIHWPPTWN